MAAAVLTGAVSFGATQVAIVPAAAPAAPAAQAAPAKPRISAAQAKELFRSVDTIFHFDAMDTGLPARQAVKRRLLTREQVVAFLKQKMDEDKDTARVERSAIVLEKFGLLPSHFALRPFLLKLLGEQVAGFYDSKTKTVNLLDWIDADAQKPVLAHELTHALQDQYLSSRHVDLDKWENAGPDGTAKTYAEDREHVRTDEMDTAREAALEGQAMVAYLDWGLEGKGQSLRTLPQLTAQQLAGAGGSDDDSPVLASAPLVLRDSLLFPYQEGLIFEQALLKDKGTDGAFRNVLNNPPASSYEVLHPADYERGEKVPVLAMADLHPLLDKDWQPYDVGVMGALDVRMLAEALNDKGAGADAALAWDGGVYYAAQARTAVSESAKNSTGSIALVYLSRWKTPEAASQFARVYSASLRKRYTTLHTDEQTATRGVYTTEEGPVLVEQKAGFVFVSHSLPLPVAAQVQALMLAAQKEQAPPTAIAAAQRCMQTGSLTAPLRRLLAAQGAMRTGLARVY